MPDESKSRAQPSRVSRAIWDWQGKNPEPRPSARVRPRLVRMLAVMAFAVVVLYWRQHRYAAVAVAGFAILNVLLAAAWPAAFLWHAGLWQKLGRAGAFVVGGLSLALFYYLVMAPAAAALRLLGRSPLQTDFPGGEGSYWSEPEPGPSSEDEYLRQF